MPSNSDDKEKQKSYCGVNICKVFTIDKKGLSAVSSSFFAAIKSAISNFDIVHFHAEGPSFFCWIPKMFGKKVVVTIHGLDHRRAKWGRFGRKYILLGEKKAVRYADEIIVLSEDVKNYFKKRYNRDTVLVYNGVNKPVKRSPKIIKKYGLEKDDYILYLGRLVPEKGIQYLIEAFNQIRTKKKLVIAGGGSDSSLFVQSIHSLAKNNPQVIFTGFVEGDVLDELYSNAYIYVLPSELEGMPISLLEAMSYGNCCLVSDIDECASVIKNYGETFRSRNIIALKMKLEMLLNDANKVNSYKNIVEDYVLSNYNWDETVKKTLSLYYKIKGE